MTITLSNLSALRDHARNGFPARVHPSRHAMLRRCMAAGLLEVAPDGSQRLTVEGVSRLAGSAPACICGPDHDCRATGCDDDCKACL